MSADFKQTLKEVVESELAYVVAIARGKVKVGGQSATSHQPAEAILTR